MSAAPRKAPRKRKRKRRNGALYTSGRADWCTPDPILELEREFIHGRQIGLDPCSGPQSHVDARVSVSLPSDGLVAPWDGLGLVHVNPPFGRKIGAWVQRASIFGDETILIVPARTETQWFADYIWPHHAAICWVRGRVRYRRGDTGETPRGVSSTFPTVIVLFADSMRARVFGALFSRLGAVTYNEGRPRRQQRLPGLCGCGGVEAFRGADLCADCRAVIGMSTEPLFHPDDPGGH